MKLQCCILYCCLSVPSKVMHIINPHTRNTTRRFPSEYMYFGRRRVDCSCACPVSPYCHVANLLKGQVRLRNSCSRSQGALSVVTRLLQFSFVSCTYSVSIKDAFIKSCPECHTVVNVKKSVCDCGH